MVKTINNLLHEKETSNFLYLLIGLLALLSILFVMGGDEGLPLILGRITGFIIVILIAYNLIECTSHVTESPEDWIEKESLDEDINLRIQDISELLERASEGKEMSQDILHERIKKIFLLKFKEVEDIPDNELNDLVRKPDEFRKAVKDEVIADFILSTMKKSSKRKKKKSLKGTSQKKYKIKIKDMIQRIDEWEDRYHG
ncbi:MAG: hypothetical protein ACOC8Y_04185 [Candidatus Natronoplasma sp.]